MERQQEVINARVGCNDSINGTMHGLVSASCQALRLSDSQFRAYIDVLERKRDDKISDYIKWIKERREGV